MSHQYIYKTEATSNVIDFERSKKTSISQDFCSSCSVKAFCLPVGLNERGIKQLDNLVKNKKVLQKGELLFREKDEFTQLYVVRSGSFKTYGFSANGTEQIINFNLPGEVLGFDALTEEQHTLRAQALETSSVCEITFKDLFLLAAELPSLQRRLLNLASCHNEKHSLFSLNSSALERLAAFLMDLSDRFKKRGLSPTKFFLSMSRQDIANYLGLTNETTSRMFSQLVKNGTIALENRYIQLLDLRKLQLCRYNSSMEIKP